MNNTPLVGIIQPIGNIGDIFDDLPHGNQVVFLGIFFHILAFEVFLDQVEQVAFLAGALKSRVDVETALEMREAVLAELPRTDALVMAAAGVPDFEAGEVEAAEAHRENLRDCDAVLVYYGAARSAWVTAGSRARKA